MVLSLNFNNAGDWPTTVIIFRFLLIAPSVCLGDTYLGMYAPSAGISRFYNHRFEFKLARVREQVLFFQSNNRFHSNVCVI
jgi:hypothetical protein